MKKTTGIKLLSCMTGAAALMTGCAAGPADQATAPVAEEASVALSSGALLETREEETYTKVANVTGDFRFDQDVLTPADEIFNLFGTAATSACAKPGFAFDEADTEYYVNVGGNLQRSYSLSLDEIRSMDSTEQVMTCSCAMGGAVANAGIKGVAVSDILSLADLDEGVNTITFRDPDGYGLPLPLSYVLEKDALLVYEIGGKALPDSQGAPLQVWMPDTVAKYFTRRVTDIELTAEAVEPEVQGPNADQRAKVSILNRFDEPFSCGDQITLEGYADDCGQSIAAVEFSLDGGETWTVYDTEDTTAERWVYWTFSVTPDVPGNYKLTVRARTADGTTSPLGASIFFTVA